MAGTQKILNFMAAFWRLIFISFLIFFVFHTLRDLLQIFNIRGNFITDFYSIKHTWCNVYCDYVTIPADLLGLLSSGIVLRRNKFDFWGFTAFISFAFVLLGFLLP